MKNSFILSRLNQFATSSLCAALTALLFCLPATVARAGDDTALTSLLGKITTAAESSKDSTLQSLGGELAAKAKSLGASLSGNPELESQLTGALQSLLGNKGPDAVAAFQKLSAAKLTPEQMGLAKEVGQVGSAFLVQKNLGALEGSESDVAQIVTSLRAGNLTAALPAIQKVSKNANLTPAQKDLLTSMAEKFAPGAKQAGELIGNGLKSLPGFGK
jgi:hypothetical protein